MPRVNIMAPVAQDELPLSREQLVQDDIMTDDVCSCCKRPRDTLLDSIVANDNNDDINSSSSSSSRLSLEDVSELKKRDNSGNILAARQFGSSQQQPYIVPGTYLAAGDAGANSGEVAGIVLGVVFGICLALWILSSLVANPFRPVVGTSSVTDGGRSGSRHRRGGSRTRSSGRRTTRSVSREEMSEYVTTSGGHRRERGGGGGGRSPRRARETIVVEETRRESRPPPREEDYGDDIVEVIEEESDISPSRHGRRQPGYRHVDPDEYGGGGRPMRKVRR